MGSALVPWREHLPATYLWAWDISCQPRQCGDTMALGCIPTESWHCLGRHKGTFSFFFMQLCCYTALPSPGIQTSRREEAPGPGISLCSNVSKQMFCSCSNQHLCSVRITVSVWLRSYANTSNFSGNCYILQTTIDKVLSRELKRLHKPPQDVASNCPFTGYIKSSLGLWGNDTLLHFPLHVNLCSFHHLQFRRSLQPLQQCLNMVEVI